MNPIWTHFCTHKMEEWLSWLRSVHINSYLELTERFIATHPYFVPSETHFDDQQNQLFQKLIVPEESVPHRARILRSFFQPK